MGRGERRVSLPDMLTQVLWILLSFGVLFVGAEALVRGGASMAVRLGLTPLVVGLTVVAYGTSMPEAIVSLKAAAQGQPGIALGNVVGSNLFNLAVILGLAAVVCPIRTHLQILKWDAPLLLGVTVVSVLAMATGELGRWVGVTGLVGAALYTWWTVRMAKKEEKEAEVEEVKPSRSVWLDLLFVAIGLGALVLGARLLVTNSVDLARDLGVAEAIIGLTIVAAGTSVPELATSVVAAIRKQPDIALGNVLGSNLFNLLFVLGGSAAVKPVPTQSISWLDLGFMIGITAVVWPMLASGRKLSRWEGGTLVASYGVYLFLMWP